MNNIKVCLIFLLFYNLNYAQKNKFEAIIKDAETLKPIEYVNIYCDEDISNNATGTISNENGEFNFDSSNTKITFSHLNYELLSVLLTPEIKEILLKPKQYVLDEIIVSNINPRDYLKNIMNLTNKRIDKNTLLKSYCRETVKVKNEFTKYSDALIDYYVQKGNGKSVLLLTQSRAIKNKNLDQEDDGSINNKNSAFDVRDYVKKAYNFESIDKLLEDDNYEFERKIKKEANGNEVEFVEIIPNEKSSEMLKKGYIIIDPKTKSIVEFKIYTSDNHIKNAKTVNLLIAKVRINKTFIWSKFKIINNQYILTYNKKQVNMHIKIGTKLDQDFDYASDLFVYEFNKNVNLPAKGYGNKSIFEAGNNFTEEFWKKYNVYPLGTETEKFINANQR